LKEDIIRIELKINFKKILRFFSTSEKKRQVEESRKNERKRKKISFPWN
jgi:hypothetical protein